jgi:hypothetical protein
MGSLALCSFVRCSKGRTCCTSAWDVIFWQKKNVYFSICNYFTVGSPFSIARSTLNSVLKDVNLGITYAYAGSGSPADVNLS